MMIGSATRTTTGKKIIGIFVAIAMVLTMSNISAYYASAQEHAEETQAEEVTPAVDETTETTETTETEAKEEPTETPAPTEAPEPNKPSDNTEEKKGADDIKSTEPTNKGAADDEGDNNTDADPWVGKEHSITVNINLYEDGKLRDTKTQIKKDDYKLPVEFDVKSYVESFKNWGAPNKLALEPVADYPKSLSISGWYDSITEDIDLYFSADNNKDGICDKYQTKVSFKVVNGSWNTGASYVQTHTLSFTKDGKYSNDKDATALLPTFPEVGTRPMKGYTNGYWMDASNQLMPMDATDAPSNQPIVVNYSSNSLTYTYHYQEIPSNTHQINFKVFVTLDGVTVDTVTVDAFSANLDEKIVATKAKIDEAVKDAIEKFNQNNDGTMADPDISVSWDNFTMEDDFVTVESYVDTIENPVSLGFVTVNFLRDVDNDEIPDKYQATINFEVKNGSLSDPNKASQRVTLTKNGDWNVDGSAYIDVPETIAEQGYKGGSWDNSKKFMNDSTVVVKKSDDGMTFTCTYVPETRPIWVVCYDEYGEENALYEYNESVDYGSVVKAVIADSEYTVSGIYADGKLVLGLPVVDGYVYDFTTTPEITIGDSENRIALYYSPDANKDMIADKYQRMVTYTAVNGTVNGASSEMVTLYDQNGNFSQTGIGHLTHIPVFAPLDGYEGGTWGANGQPTSATQITQDTNFVIVYDAKAPVVPDDEPGDNNNNNDNNNSNTTTNNGNPVGPFVGNYIPADDTADEATEPEADEEEAIEDTENPLVAPSDEQTIADDENALAGYEEGSEQTWLPFAIVAGVLCAGLLLFLVARRKRDEEDARSAY